MQPFGQYVRMLNGRILLHKKQNNPYLSTLIYHKIRTNQ